jgi:hypothetical protein
LGIAPLPEAQPTVPQEGHVAEWPLWSFSKRQSTVTWLRIDYEDGTYFQLDIGFVPYAARGRAYSGSS